MNFLTWVGAIKRCLNKNNKKNQEDWNRIQCLLEKLERSQKESRMYKEFWDYAEEAFLLVAVESGEILDANPMACSIYGYSRDEIKQKNITDLSAEPEGTKSVFVEKIHWVPIRYHKNHDETKLLVSASVSYFNDKAKDVAAIIIRPILDRRVSDGVDYTEQKYRRSYE